MKTIGQLLREFSRFAAFDACCRLQVALGVKGKRQQCENGGKHYCSQPETAQTHQIHSVRRNPVGRISCSFRLFKFEIPLITNRRRSAEITAIRNFPTTQHRYLSDSTLASRAAHFVLLSDGGWPAHGESCTNFRLSIFYLV